MRFKKYLVLNLILQNQYVVIYMFLFEYKKKHSKKLKIINEKGEKQKSKDKLGYIISGIKYYARRGGWDCITWPQKLVKEEEHGGAQTMGGTRQLDSSTPDHMLLLFPALLSKFFHMNCDTLLFFSFFFLDY